MVCLAQKQGHLIMWGFEKLLKEESAGDDFSLIFDKVQDTFGRMTSIFEMGGLSKQSTDEFDWPLKADHWVDSEDSTRHAYVYYTDPSHANLVTNLIIQLGVEVHTFKMLSLQQFSDPHSVTGDIADAYIEQLDEIDDWLKHKFGLDKNKFSAD
jgi:hypothetical protein